MLGRSFLIAFLALAGILHPHHHQPHGFPTHHGHHPCSHGPIRKGTGPCVIHHKRHIHNF